MQSIGVRPGPDEQWWYRERRAVLARALARVGGPEPGRDQALDVGAGRGALSLALLDHGWQVTAVDADPAAVARCREAGVDAHVADARWLPLPTASFDLTLAFDVLAHVDDDLAAAREMARVLKPGGSALVSVPCDLALWSAHDIARGRVRRYTRATLMRLLAEAGLICEQVTHWNVLLRPAVRLRRHCVDGWEPRPRHPVVNRLLAWLLAAERRLPVGSFPGTTLLARARRPG
ncbi:class I SAM-dependent methyltransferase [Actinomadura flavalba]|uniref:class I SAM-dependent methyltransferase n=1 Tax=Actinomadura flavalba TaxID=1120938 RepID=UPI001F0B6CFB|nr:class I SAM-dependent methyltransferase [Actinomadura flavalba]